MPALAQGDGGKNITPDASELPNPLKVKSLQDLFTAVIRGLWPILMAIATVMVLYGAYQIMSSAGDPGKVENGKKTILYAAIGVALLLLSSAIIFILQNLLGYTGK